MNCRPGRVQHPHCTQWIPSRHCARETDRNGCTEDDAAADHFSRKHSEEGGTVLDQRGLCGRDSSRLVTDECEVGGREGGKFPLHGCVQLVASYVVQAASGTYLAKQCSVRLPKRVRVHGQEARERYGRQTRMPSASSLLRARLTSLAGLAAADTCCNPFTVTSHVSEALLKFYFQDIPPPRKYFAALGVVTVALRTTEQRAAVIGYWHAAVIGYWHAAVIGYWNQLSGRSSAHRLTSSGQEVLCIVKLPLRTQLRTNVQFSECFNLGQRLTWDTAAWDSAMTSEGHVHQSAHPCPKRQHAGGPSGSEKHHRPTPNSRRFNVDITWCCESQHETLTLWQLSVWRARNKQNVQPTPTGSRVINRERRRSRSGGTWSVNAGGVVAFDIKWQKRSLRQISSAVFGASFSAGHMVAAQCLPLVPRRHRTSSYHSLPTTANVGKLGGCCLRPLSFLGLLPFLLPSNPVAALSTLRFIPISAKDLSINTYLFLLLPSLAWAFVECVKSYPGTSRVLASLTVLRHFLTATFSPCFQISERFVGASDCRDCVPNWRHFSLASGKQLATPGEIDDGRLQTLRDLNQQLPRLTSQGRHFIWRWFLLLTTVATPRLLRRRGGVVVTLLASHQGEPGSIPRIFARGNRAGRCSWSAGFHEDLSLPLPLRFGAALCSPHFTIIGSQDLDVKSRPDPFTHSWTFNWVMFHVDASAAWSVEWSGAGMKGLEKRKIPEKTTDQRRLLLAENKSSFGTRSVATGQHACTLYSISHLYAFTRPILESPVGKAHACAFESFIIGRQQAPLLSARYPVTAHFPAGWREAPA
ncbi:hypothetical protein PR048_014860 [Dryococelus australis]|uniref:Uncharacterized protein n=1 Tax=Dryococelus australis TaxID=614101 RepID=A0ABQ9HFB8_9NEOP|nr:hypothetical protein PR048_014860 [Dryococelus australis]